MADSRDDVPIMGQGLTWESMTPGSSFRTAARTITESDLMAFVHVAGFNEPLFYDASHAAAVINQHGTEVAVFTPVRLIRGRDYQEAGA